MHFQEKRIAAPKNQENYAWDAMTKKFNVGITCLTIFSQTSTKNIKTKQEVCNNVNQN